MLMWQHYFSDDRKLVDHGMGLPIVSSTCEFAFQWCQYLKSLLYWSYLIIALLVTFLIQA